MSGAPTLCAVILAAGASSRMGRDKALLPWPPASTSGETLLTAAIDALKPFAESIIIVAGRNAEALASLTKAHGASLVVNPAPERGQFSSLQTGLRAALDHGCEAAMITPVDCPPLSASSLRLLCRAFEQALTRGAWAVAPEQDGRRGHPLLAGRELVGAYLAAAPTSSAREVKQAHSDKFEYIAVPDPLLTADVNTPEQYSALAAGKRR